MGRISEKLFYAVEFCFAASILIIALLLSVRFTAESEKTAELENELRELETQNQILTAEYESGINLFQIERYATETLGMCRREPEQIVFIIDQVG